MAEPLRRIPKREEGWEALPYWSQQRLPITANIPYYYRWKISQIKLMLNDLQYLCEKHGVTEACKLYTIVGLEADELFKKISEHIEKKKEWEGKW